MTTSYTYNTFGEVLTATDALGHTTTNNYDTKGNLLSVTTPVPDGNSSASITQFGYDSKGQLTSITDPLNHVTTMTYTAAGLVQTITDAANHVTTYEYDPRGNRTAVVDAMQNRTEFAYDSGNRLLAITYPDSTTSSFGYDYRGRRTSATDQNGKVTTYTFDDADRLLTVTDATQHVTTYNYDTENNLTSITDASGHTTSFIHDAFGRVVQTTFPSTLTESYGYDAIGNMTSRTDRKGVTISYVYDALNRLTHKGYPDSTGVDFVYDLVGKVQQVNDATGNYGFAYDNMGRLIGTTTQYSFLSQTTFTNANTYDAASNRVSGSANDNTVSYTYDTLNRITNLSSTWAGSFGFGYDDLSRRTNLTRPNGVNSAYSYDNLSRLQSVLHQLGGVNIDGASYGLDNSGNRTSKSNLITGTTENYSYDDIYQLTKVLVGNTTTEHYTYDAVGNRLSDLTSQGWSYNASNQLGSTSTAAFTYDNNGNTTSKADSSGVTTYSWDYENRLIQVQLPGSGQNPGGIVTFKYDPFGRRIQKSGASGTSNFAYDGANIVGEYGPTGSLVAKYIQGTGIDEPLAMNRSGSTSFYEADGLGSITSLTDGSGSAVGVYTYDAFGKLTSPANSMTNPFQYTGREWDSETGLYYYRARYYDPGIGRFLGEDPIGIANETRSQYGYVSNDPVNFIDPSGNIKIKGKWCGPHWTGGEKDEYIPSKDKDGYYQPPIGYVDKVCSWHDKCYSRCRDKHPCSSWGRRFCEKSATSA